MTYVVFGVIALVFFGIFWEATRSSRDPNAPKQESRIGLKSDMFM